MPRPLRTGSLAPPSSQYDSDAFDSMAVVNTEEWNEGEADEGGVTRADLLPQVREEMGTFVHR